LMRRHSFRNIVRKSGMNRDRHSLESAHQRPSTSEPVLKKDSPDKRIHTAWALC
jgi:hypothetical protein